MVSFALHGIGVSGGIAIGRAHLVSHATREVAHYTIRSRKCPPRSSASRPQSARCSAVEGLHAGADERRCAGEFGAFLDVHLDDPQRSDAVGDAARIIAEQRCNAEWALTLQMGVLVDQFEQIEDTYLRERKSDVLQVGERVLKRLMGQPGRCLRLGGKSRRSSSRTTCRRPTSIQFKQHHFAAS